MHIWGRGGAEIDSGPIVVKFLVGLTASMCTFWGRGGAEIDSGPIIVKFLVGLTASMCTSSIPCTSFDVLP